MPQTYDPMASTPYTPTELPPVEQSPIETRTLQQPPAPMSGNAPQGLMPGTTAGKVGGIAFVAHNIMQGFAQGRQRAEAQKTFQMNRLQKGLETVYNQSALGYHDLITSGETDQAKIENAKAAVDASWAALTKFYGKQVGAFDTAVNGGKKSKSSSSSSGQPMSEDPTALLTSQDPNEKAQGWFQVMMKSGPPIYHQTASYTSPLATAQRQSAIQTAQYESDIVSKRAEMVKLQNDPLTATDPQKQAALERLRSTPGILQRPLPAPPTQLILGETLPAGTTDMYGQPVNAKMPYRMVNNGTAGYGYMPVAEKPVATGTVKIFDPNDPTKIIQAAQFRYPYSNRVEVRIPGPNGEGTLVEHPYEVPPGWVAPKTTTHTNVDPSGFKSTGTSTVSSPTPHMTTPPPIGATPVAAPATAPPASPNQLPPGAQNLPATPQQVAAAQHPAPLPNATPHHAPPTQPLGMGMKAYNSLNDVGRSQVDAAADNFWKYGDKPGTKYDKPQAVAKQILREQGVDLNMLPTSGTQGQIETARIIDPLIARARELIAADPNALGPLRGNISNLMQKAGMLSGAPKELAGTLISIYSLAGKLHGWRAIQVADEFRKAYGDITESPAALNSGLDAMLGTTRAIESTQPHVNQPNPVNFGQGGGTTPPGTPPKTPPPTAGKPKNAAEYLQSIGVP